MAVLETSRDQAQRQKWLTGLIAGGLSVTALAIVAAYLASARHGNKAGQPTPSPSTNIKQQLSDYTFTRSDQGRPVFKIHAARTVSYEDSRSMTLEDVRVEIYGRKGDTGDILRTDRCQYTPQSGDFIAAGPVQIALSAKSEAVPATGLRGRQRIDIETSGVSYHQNTKIAETDAPVKMRMGEASGTARGMSYDLEGGGLELRHEVAVDVRVEVAVEAPAAQKKARGAPIHLTASALQYNKLLGTIALSGPVNGIQGTNRASSNHALIQLGANRRLSQIVLDGSVKKGIDSAPGREVDLAAERVQGDFNEVSGEIRHVTAESGVSAESKNSTGTNRLTADRADFDFKGKQPKPIQGVAKGNVRVESQTAAAKDSKQSPKPLENNSLVASELHMAFRPGANGLQNVQTAGPGTLTLAPMNAKSGKKVANAGQFTIKLDSQSRIESLHGSAPTQVLFYPPPSQPQAPGPSESRADSLDATFDPATQTLRNLKQTGNFQYLDGDRRASSASANYDPLGQTLVLLGHPQIWDPESRISAQKITVDTRANTALGEGSVQGFHHPAPATGTASTTNTSSPTNILADKVVANKTSQTIHYEGNVRAWNGTDVLKAPSLDVYRADRRLSSPSRVLTSFVQASQPSTKSDPHTAAASHPVTVQADSLEYLDTGRRARYHGNVLMTSDDIVMQSDRLDVYLTQPSAGGGSQVERAEADGHVKVTQPERRGTSNHAEYFAGPGKVVLSGGPPLLVDEKKGSTTGQSLTFFVHDDRLFVDGGSESPSVTQHRITP